MSSNSLSLSDSHEYDEPSISSDMDINEVSNLSSTEIDNIFESSNESESELEYNELEMLTDMSREDLFLYIKTDPAYYIQLIEQNKLGQQLAIIPSRDEQGNLRIKFKIHPEQRWTEVGYFSKCSDTQVLEEFVNQINHNIHRTPVDPRDQVHSHLESQLDGNNNMQSDDYMKDVEALRRKCNNDLPVGLHSKSKTKKFKDFSTFQSKGMSKGNSEDEPMTKPKTEIEHYTEQLIERLIKAIPKILILEKRSYQYKILAQLSKNQPPEQIKPIFQKFSQNLKNREFIYNFHTSINWSQFPELHTEIIDFHRQAIQTSPTIYQNLDFQNAPLDDLDHQILDRYGLKVEEIWADYLASLKNMVK